MLEYRCKELDDELDDFDEPSGVNLDDDLGEYDMDDDEGVAEIIVTETVITPIASEPAMPAVIVVEESTVEPPPARKPAKKAPAASKAPMKKAAAPAKKAP